MERGIPQLTLPAGYLGSSFIGACLIACGFDINASKVASIVLGVVFPVIVWWGLKPWTYVCCSLVSLIVKRGSYNHRLKGVSWLWWYVFYSLSSGLFLKALFLDIWWVWVFMRLIFPSFLNFFFLLQILLTGVVSCMNSLWKVICQSGLKHQFENLAWISGSRWHGSENR